MSKKTTILIIILALITSGLLYLALRPTAPKEVVVTPTPTPTIFLSPAAATTLSLTPLASPASAYQQTLAVNITSGKNAVSGVQIELAFDPKIISNVKVTPGNFFATPNVLINNIDTSNGRISYALGAQLGHGGHSGNGIVAYISFDFLSTTEKQTSISFLPKSVVTADGALASVLKATSGITITVLPASNSSTRSGQSAASPATKLTPVQ